MSEHGIIAKPEKVLAFLAGATQMRVPIRLRDVNEECIWCNGEGFEYIDCGNDEMSGYDYRCPCRCRMPRSPFGVPGDVVWFKETWSLRTGSQHDHHSRIFFKDGEHKLIYWQDGHKIGRKYGLLVSEDKWRSSTQMPRWASRIIRTVKRVWVEPLSKGTVEDAVREGYPGRNCGVTPKVWMVNCWETLYEGRGLDLLDSPYCFCAEFEEEK